MKLKLSRRNMLRMSTGAIGGVLTGAGFAQVGNAGRALTIVVPTPAGGMFDALARLIAQHLSTSLAQPVVIENKAGASTMLATQAVAKAPADGLTLLLNSAQLVQNPLLYKKPGYDAFNSFTPVIRVGTTVTVLAIRPDPSVNSLKSFIAKAKARSEPMNYGTQGIGSAHHIYTEILARQAGLAVNQIPYKGEAPMLPDLAEGRLDMGWLSVMGSQQYAAEKKVQLLAATGKKRPGAMPNVPTFAELGFAGGLDTDGWIGLFAPYGTPDATVHRLSSEINKIIATAAVRERLISFGVDPVSDTPREFARFLRRSHEDWSGMIKTTGVVVE